MKKWTFRILIALVVLIGLGVVGVQIVLWTELPSRIVVREIEAQTGLSVSLGTLNARWGGRTTARDIEIRGPLSDEPMLRVARVEVEHRSLPMLLARRDLGLEMVAVSGVKVRLERDEQGRWNVERLLEGLADDSSGGSATVELPRVDLESVEVSVRLFGAEAVALPPLEVHGAPAGRRRWTFRAMVDGAVGLEGRVAPGGAWEHEITFDGEGLERLAAPFTSEPLPSPIDVAGTWTGRLVDDGVRGAMTLRAVRAGDATGHGRVDLAIGPEGADASNIRLELQDARLGLDAITMTGGAVRAGAASIVAERVRVEAYDTRAVIDGRWEPAPGIARLSARWESLAADAPIRHHGALDCSVDMPAIGPRRIRLSAEGGATLPGGALEAALTLTGDGRAWDDLAGDLRFPRLVWRDTTRHVDASGMVAAWESAWPAVRVTSLTVPGGQTEATASVDATARAWTVAFAARDWRVPGLDAEPIALRLDAAGDDTTARVALLEIVTPQFSVRADGAYRPDAATPIDARATVVARIDAMHIGAPADVTAGPPVGAASTVRLEAGVTGHAEPLALDITGLLTASDLTLATGRLGAFSAPLTARLTADGATYESGEIALLGGVLRFDGILTPGNRDLGLRLEADRIALQEAWDLLGAPLDIAGAVSWRGLITMPDLDPARMKAEGEWQVNDVHAAGAIIDGRGRLTTSGPRIELRDMRLSAGDGVIEGEADYDPKTKQVHLRTSSRRWPVAWPDAGLALAMDARTDVTVDLTTYAARGSLDADGVVSVGDREVGTLRAQGRLNDRTLEVSSFDMALLGGAVQGDGTIPLDDWMTSAGEVRWSGIDLARLTSLVPETEGLAGAVSGRATIAAATDPRAPEPVVIKVVMESAGARFRDVALGAAEVDVYVGRDRMVIERSTMSLAGGTARVWGRLGRHGSEPFGFVDASFEEMGLNEILRAAGSIPAESATVYGRVSGVLSGGGYLRTPHRMFGRARATLVESDIASIPMISALYDMLSLKIGKSNPEGRGTAAFSLEGDAIELTRLTYFNRGIDVVARVRIDDLWAGADSAVSGFAAGAARPLKEIDLPLFRDLDVAVQALQKDAGSVEISGTLGEPVIKPVPLAEVGRALKLIFSN